MKNLRQTGTRQPAPAASAPAAAPGPVAPVTPAAPSAPAAPATTTETPSVVTPAAPTSPQAPAAPPVPNRIMPGGMIRVRAVAPFVSCPHGVERKGAEFDLPEDRFRAMGSDVARVNR